MEALGREPSQGGEKEGYLIKYLFTNKNLSKQAHKSTHTRSIKKRRWSRLGRTEDPSPPHRGLIKNIFFHEDDLLNILYVTEARSSRIRWRHRPEAFIKVYSSYPGKYSVD